MAATYSQTVGTVASLIYTPTPNSQAHVVIFNNSMVPVYLGSSGGTASTATTTTSGLALFPDNEISFSTATAAIYAVAETGASVMISAGAT